MALALQLLLLVSLMAVESYSQNTCPTECTCIGSLVDCYGRRLSEIPENLPDNTRHLDLQDNEIIEIQGKKLSHLHQLESLHLRLNQLTELRSHSFENLTSLKQLQLGSNDINTLEPDAFLNLQAIQVIDMANNQLSNVTGCFQNIPSLERLGLSLNKLTEITDETLAGLGNLVYLILSQNRISTISHNAFLHSPKLSFLVLRGNPIVNADNIFTGIDLLSFLDLSSCLMTSIPQGMPWTLRYLRMSNNSLTVLGSHDLAQVRHLGALNLETNYISMIQAGAFSHAPYLTDIRLSNNQLHTLPPEIPKNVETFRADNNRIQVVNQTNFAHDSDMKQLSLNGNNISRLAPNTFSRLANLNSLHLANNQVQLLQNRTFMGLRKLQSLDLTGNPLHQIETRAFGGLQKVTQLKLAEINTNLTLIQGNIFQDLPSLVSLDLHSSQDLVKNILNSSQMLYSLDSVQRLNLNGAGLLSIRSDIKTYLPSIKTFKLGKNPWICDQQLLPLIQWMRSSQRVFAPIRDVQCTSPEWLKGRQLAKIVEADFTTPTTTTTTTTTTTPTTTTTIISMTTTLDTTDTAASSPQFTTLRSLTTSFPENLTDPSWLSNETESNFISFMTTLEITDTGNTFSTEPTVFEESSETSIASTSYLQPKTPNTTTKEKLDEKTTPEEITMPSFTSTSDRPEFTSTEERSRITFTPQTSTTKSGTDDIATTTKTTTGKTSMFSTKVSSTKSSITTATSTAMSTTEHSTFSTVTTTTNQPVLVSTKNTASTTEEMSRSSSLSTSSLSPSSSYATTRPSTQATSKVFSSTITLLPKASSTSMTTSSVPTPTQEETTPRSNTMSLKPSQTTIHRGSSTSVPSTHKTTEEQTGHSGGQTTYRSSFKSTHSTTVGITVPQNLNTTITNKRSSIKNPTTMFPFSETLSTTLASNSTKQANATISKDGEYSHLPSMKEGNHQPFFEQNKFLIIGVSCGAFVLAVVIVATVLIVRARRKRKRISLNNHAQSFGAETNDTMFIINNMEVDGSDNEHSCSSHSSSGTAPAPKPRQGSTSGHVSRSLSTGSSNSPVSFDGIGAPNDDSELLMHSWH